MDCGDKRSAAPLWNASPHLKAPSRFTCQRSPKSADGVAVAAAPPKYGARGNAALPGMCNVLTEISRWEIGLSGFANAFAGTAINPSFIISWLFAFVPPSSSFPAKIASHTKHCIFSGQFPSRFHAETTWHNESIGSGEVGTYPMTAKRKSLLGPFGS